MKNLSPCLFILLLIFSPVKGQIIQSGDGTIWENNTTISLNGNWQFKFINGSNWTSYGNFYAPNYDASSWSQLEVPSNWEMKGILNSQYVIPIEGTGLYRTQFQLPAQWSDSAVFIRFDGVLMGYECWINGQYAGKWESAYNSRQFNITSFIQPGNNLLAVRVYTRYAGYEFDTHDDWAVSGIFRDVSIFPVSNNHLNYFKLESSVNGSDAELRIKYAVSSFNSQGLQNINLSGELYSPSGNLISNFSTNINEILTGKSDTLTETIHITGASLWTAETPSLYTIKISLRENALTIQNYERKIGLRQIQISNKQILLNGTPLKLRGVNYHETDPYNGKVLNRQHRLKDLLMMKKANINYIRTAHYPPHPDFFDLCDSLGFYVSCEVPFGFGDNYLTDPAFKLPLLNRADATVSRHQNYPSVIIWSIGNENEITTMTAEVGLHVKQIDPTRPICYPQAGGMFYWRDYNNYPSHIDIFAPHYPDVATLNHYISTAQRPLLITEMSHSLGLAFEDHDKLWELIQQNDITAGGAVWEWADQAIALTGNRTDNYTKTNHLWLDNTHYFSMNGNQGADGIVYADRTPQPDYWEVRKNYAQVRVEMEEVQVSTGSQNISIPISNRYDFLNLQNILTCTWYLTRNRDTIQSGNFIPNCASGQSSNQSITITIPDSPFLHIYLLHLNFIDNHNQMVNDHVVRLLSASENKPAFINLLTDAALPTVPFLSNSTDSIQVNASTYNFSMSSLNGMWTLDHTMNFIQSGPFIRTGRRATIAEETIVPGKILTKYLMNHSTYSLTSASTIDDSVLIKGTYLYDNNNIQMQGPIDYKLSKNGSIEINFNLSPSGPDKLFQESGLAFLLHQNITEIRWLGFGPFSSNPGKENLNHYGTFCLEEDDIYFEGNRRGTDLALLTDASGNGVLIVADSSNISFEKTDEGIIVTYNTHVAGLGSKFSETSYPVYTSAMGNLTGHFYIIPVDGNNWFMLLNNLFGNPANSGESTKPFIATSDTYPQKFSSLINGSSGCIPTATASTYQTGNVPANTLDNNLSSRWSAEGDGVYITYDLCTTSLVEAVMISFQNGNYRVSTFDLLYSADGITFTPIQTSITSSGNTSDLETFPITPVITRFIRIIGHGNSLNDWTSIQEVKFTTQSITNIIAGNESKKNLKVFPNPAREELSILLEDPIQKIEILSDKGMLIKELWGSAVAKTISIADIGPGLYTIKITSSTRDVFISKFVKMQ